MATLIKSDRLRVCSISRLGGVSNIDGIKVTDMPVSYGLGVEYNYDDDNHYITIAFVKYNAHNKECGIELVGNRMQEYITIGLYEQFVTLLNYASTLVKMCNDVECSFGDLK